MRILIVGAGKAGLYLALELRRRHQVTVIETRLARADMVNSMMPDVTVIHGDACEPEVLEHAGISETDVTIAATGDDEDNIVVAMLAKHYGDGKVFARINHPKNEWLFTKQFGVDVPVSSARVLLSLVEKEIGFGDLVTLLRLQAEHVSIEEITLVSGAGAIGKRLAEVQLPPTAHIMAIIAPDQGLTIATGETVLSEGDQLLLISQGEEEDPGIRTALGL